MKHMLEKLIEKIKPILKKLATTSAFFIGVYFIGWCLNGILQLHFDLSSLQNFYMLILGRDVAKHGFDSVCNSPKGEMPNFVDKK